MELRISLFNKSNNINFNSRAKYKALTQVPKTPCAICGGTTITSTQLDKFWSKVTRPLSTLMIEGRMDYWKEKFPEVWSKLVLFAGLYPQKSLDTILEDKELKKNTTKEFHKIIIKKREEENTTEPLNAQAGHYLLQSVINRSREFLRSAGVVMKEASKMQESIDTCASQVNKDIFKQLQIYAQKYPRKSLFNIMHLPEVYRYHKQRCELNKIKDIDLQKFHFQNIRKLTKKYGIEKFQKIEERAFNIILGDDEPNLKRAQIKQLYRNALKEANKPKLLEKIEKEIDNIPMTLKNADSYFFRAAEKHIGDGNIIAGVLLPHENTFEHILPASKNGQDNIYNGIVLCRHCNKERGNQPYSRMLSAYPQAAQNFHRQMEHTIKAIEKGKLTEKFEDYPIKVSPFIYSQTCQTVNLETPVLKYSKKLARRKNKEMETTKEELQTIAKQETEEAQRIKELKKALYESQQKLDELKKTKAQKTIEHNTASNVKLLAENFVRRKSKK